MYKRQALEDAVKVLIVDDERLARQKLRRFLEGEPDVRTIAECASRSSSTMRTFTASSRAGAG